MFAFFSAMARHDRIAPVVFFSLCSWWRKYLRGAGARGRGGGGEGRGERAAALGRESGAHAPKARLCDDGSGRKEVHAEDGLHGTRLGHLAPDDLELGERHCGWLRRGQAAQQWVWGGG